MTQGRFVADVEIFSRVVELHPVKYAIPNICIMMHVYCQLLPENACSSPAPSQVKVKKLKKATIMELSQETNLLDSFNEFVLAIFRHYLCRTNTDCLTAGSRLLIACGKLMNKVGEALATHRKVNNLSLIHI